MQHTACFPREAPPWLLSVNLLSSAPTQRTGIRLVHKPLQKFEPKPSNDLNASAAIVDCASQTRRVSSGINARLIKETMMDSDLAQAALSTVCRFVHKECRDEVLMQLRRQRSAANQRALMARRKNEELQLEVDFLRVLNSCLLKQVRTLHLLGGGGCP